MSSRENHRCERIIALGAHSVCSDSAIRTRFDLALLTVCSRHNSRRWVASMLPILTKTRTPWTHIVRWHEPNDSEEEIRSLYVSLSQE